MTRSPLRCYTSIIRSSALVLASSSLSMGRARTWPTEATRHRNVFSPFSREFSIVVGWPPGAWFLVLPSQRLTTQIAMHSVKESHTYTHVNACSQHAQTCMQTWNEYHKSDPPACSLVDKQPSGRQPAASMWEHHLIPSASLLLLNNFARDGLTRIYGPR